MTDDDPTRRSLPSIRNPREVPLWGLGSTIIGGMLRYSLGWTREGRGATRESSTACNSCLVLHSPQINKSVVPHVAYCELSSFTAQHAQIRIEIGGRIPTPLFQRPLPQHLSAILHASQLTRILPRVRWRCCRRRCGCCRRVLARRLRLRIRRRRQRCGRCPSGAVFHHLSRKRDPRLFVRRSGRRVVIPCRFVLQPFARRRKIASSVGLDRYDGAVLARRGRPHLDVTSLDREAAERSVATTKGNGEQSHPTG